MKAAELTWKEGLLLKGNGLCHGIAGNGLLLHSVARWHEGLSYDWPSFKDNVLKYRVRALMFARALSLESVQTPIEENEDRQRMNVGIADHPWSLMEGLAGEICMIADLIHPDDLTHARFPAYDALF